MASSFRVNHLHNIRDLPPILLNKFLNNVLKLCKYVEKEKNIIPVNGMEIFRVGKLYQFDVQYWPLGIGAEAKTTVRPDNTPYATNVKVVMGLEARDGNELVFTNIEINEPYLKEDKPGENTLLMCRRFNTVPNIFALNFEKNLLLNTDLIDHINECIIIPIIFLHSLPNRTTIKSKRNERNQRDDIYIGNITKFLLNKTYLEIKDEIQNNQDVSDIKLGIRNIPGYDEFTIFEGNYLRQINLLELLNTWSPFTQTRSSHYVADRLYAHYLGSVLDLIEQYYHAHIIKDHLVGAYFPQITSADGSTFPAEFLIRKKIFLTPTLRNVIFEHETLQNKNKHCNSILTVKRDGRIKINKYLLPQEIFNASSRDPYFDGGKKHNKTKSLKKCSSKFKKYNQSKRKRVKKTK